MYSQSLCIGYNKNLSMHLKCYFYRIFKDLQYFYHVAPIPANAVNDLLDMYRAKQAHGTYCPRSVVHFYIVRILENLVHYYLFSIILPVSVLSLRAQI